MANKMTKKDYFNLMREHFSSMPEFENVVNFIDHEIELLDKKNATKSGKPTAKQIESEALKPILLEVLRSGVIAKCSDIIRSDERLANYTTQKISPILKKMEAEGTVVKIVKGKDVLYSANDQ